MSRPTGEACAGVAVADVNTIRLGVSRLARFKMIENLRAELQVKSLEEMRVLQNGKIPCAEPGACQHVSSHVAECSLGRDHESVAD